MLGKILVIAVRVTALAAMLGAGVAMLVSPPLPEPLRRHAAVPPGMVLPRSLTDRAGTEPQLLHPDTSRVEALAPMLPGGISLDLASFSPWEDRGRRQIVGVAWSRGGFDGASGLEMIRMELPEGEILDRIPLLGDPLPNDAPCWLPGTLARVVYPGADGRIYRLDFEAAWAGGGSGHPPEVRPRELPWQPSPIADASPFVSDLSRDEEDASGCRMLASVQFRGAAAGAPGDWQLWWLELDRGATRIVAAGRLLDADETGLKVRRRHPRIFRDVDGRPRLAYVATRIRERENELRAVALPVAPGSDIPPASEAGSRVVARGILLAPPAIAPDRRSFAVLRAGGQSLEADRVPIERDIIQSETRP